MNPACWLCGSSSLSTFLRSDLSASTWVTDSHVWGADADGLAEHVTVLQRPLVTHDALKLVRSMALENHGECGCAGSLLDKVT